MSFDFTNLFHLGFLVAAVLCTVLHFVSVFVSAGWAKFALPANLVIHIIMIFCLLFGGAALDFAVLTFAVSTLVFTAMFFVKYELDQRGKRAEKEETGDL